MKKNVILVVALIALMTGVLSAQTYDSESDFQVTKNGNAITITGYKGSKTAVSIPPNIQNTPVTSIGNNAFEDRTNLTGVTIPASVTSIGNGAFLGCSKLTSITIPNGVNNIGQEAFYGCTSLISVTFQGTIGSAKFRNDSFPGIGDLRAKFYATDTANGTPGTYTRSNATSTTWTVPAVTTAAPSGDSESDFEVKKEGNAITITKYVGKKTVVNIPPRIQNTPVTSIGIGAFNGNTSLTSVTIPNGVISIVDMAFSDCKNLTSVTIPNSVTSIGSGAFQSCTSLTSITIPASVTKFGQMTFRGCTSLTNVTFQGAIPIGNFVVNVFDGLGDLRAKFYATDKANGTAGTYTRPAGTQTWTKK